MDFNNQWGDCARYLPAPNIPFVRFAEQPSTAASKARLPSGIVPKHLNFLKPSSPFFCWPDILYTATFAVGDDKQTIITERDRANSFVLGDSGGFSVIKGVIKSSMASWRASTLIWQERDCDVGIIVDVPTQAIDEAASGYKTFQACLDQTVDNTKYVINNRSRSELKLLTVYQGRDRREADRWAKVIEAYQLELEGMAIAGRTRLEIADWIRRIISMIDRGLFDNVRHIHFLGTAQPKFAVLATALKRALRKHVRADIEVTFDSSTSFAYVHKHGQIITGFSADKDFAVTSHTMPNRGGEFNPLGRFPYRGPLADRCTIGDFLPGTDPTKNPADAIGTNMLSHHSVYAELSAILQANRLVDMVQAGMNSVVPHEISLAVQLIDEAFAGSGRALADLIALFHKPENEMKPSFETRGEEG